MEKSRVIEGPSERLNYFQGQFLTQELFELEQRYHREKRLQHNALLHGVGTVCGLKVSEHPRPERRDRFVVIEPGLALDKYGREIWVPKPVYVSLDDSMASCAAPAGDDDDGRHLLISLCYDECGADLTPSLSGECACGDSQQEPNRIRESYRVELQRVDAIPQRPALSPHRCRAEWAHTVSVDKPYRLAYDRVRNCLFVLNGANPPRVYVVDARTHCLLNVFEVGSPATDIAVSPEGDRVYVGVFDADPPGCPQGEHKVYIFDASNLTSIPRIGLLRAGAGTSQSALRLAVAREKDGRIWALNTNESKVYVWRPPNYSWGQPADSAAALACILVGRDPRR